MAQDEVKELRKLLSEHLTGKTIKNVATKRLGGPGENAGSIMFQLDITTQEDNTKKEDELHVVIKTLPAGEMWRSIFNIQVTYAKEMAFYEVIVPTLRQFQKELGIDDVIDCFANCLVTRKNLLTNSDVIDDDAALVFENLSFRGYSNIDRLKGFDVETAKLVLNNIADLHGVALALKLKKPNLFEEKVKKYCHTFVSTLPLAISEFVRLVIMENKEAAKKVPEVFAWGQVPNPVPREPYATIIHEDLWVNNTMQKFSDGVPIDSKLVDFQLLDYGSPACDVFFFLWSSVPQAHLEKHLDHLLRYYHTRLIAVLGKHHCDVTPFTYETFLDEMKHVSSFQFGHAMQFHLMAVSGPRGKDREKINIHDAQTMYRACSYKAKRKAWYMVEECSKRGWL